MRSDEAVGRSGRTTRRSDEAVRRGGQAMLGGGHGGGQVRWSGEVV